MTDTFQLPLLRSNDHKRNSEKKNLIYTDEVRVSNIDHTKIIKRNFRLFYQNAENRYRRVANSRLLLQKSTFSQKVAVNKHQFSPLKTACKSLWVLLNNMCYCLLLYCKRKMFLLLLVRFGDSS